MLTNNLAQLPYTIKLAMLMEAVFGVKVLNGPVVGKFVI